MVCLRVRLPYRYSSKDVSGYRRHPRCVFAYSAEAAHRAVPIWQSFLSPPYLDEIVHVADLPSHHRLRSSSSHRLQVPAYRLATVGRRSFPIVAFILWNSLPPDIQSSASLTDFYHRLKIYLFQQSFPDILL